MAVHSLIVDKAQGDTIVEVLITMAIISLILAAAYVTTNKSLLAERSAQERAEALQIVQGQIEQLKSAFAVGTVNLAAATYSPGFCVNGAKLLVVSGNPCNFNEADGYVASNPVEPYYHAVINYDTPSPSTTDPSQVTIKATWSAIDGGTDNLEMVYQLN